MTKKYILNLIVVLSIFPATLVFAATPSLSISGSGDGNNVLVTVTGAEPNSSASLYFTSTVDNTTHSQVLGYTNTIGTFSGTQSTSGIGINNTVPVYIMVNGYSSNSVTWPYNSTSPQQQITFSQNNPTIALGQSSTLTVSDGNGNYYISSNSNSSIVTVSISGNTISFSGAGTGSSVITVCSVSGGTCGITTITVNQNNAGSMSFSPSSLTLVTNQSGSVQINGGTAPYTISTISGDTTYYSFSGNVLTISARNSGARTVRICSSGSMCNSLTLNVTDSQSNALIVTPSSLTLNAGQTGSVQIVGGNAPYTVSTASGNTLYTSISGSVLTVSGTISGATTLTICASNSICSSLIVTVGGNVMTTNQMFSFPMAINQSIVISLSGGNGSAYYLQSGVSTPVLANVYNNSLTATGKAYGSTTVTVCQNSNTCMPFTFVVNQAGDPGNGTGGPYTFNNDLWFGETDSDVTELQNYLIGENYLSSMATGYFGTMTLDAVKRFQTEKGVSATGYVGPLTRAVLNN